MFINPTKNDELLMTEDSAGVGGRAGFVRVMSGTVEHDGDELLM